MPDIRGGVSLVTLTKTEKRVERNTANLEDWLRAVVNEIRRFRLGDESATDEELV